MPDPGDPVPNTANPPGLSDAEAARRLREVGPNRLPRDRATPWWDRFADAFRSPLVLLLVGALAFDLGAWAFEGAHDVPIEAIAIAAILVLNALLEVAQGARAERALQALESLAVPTVRVRRDGRLVERSAEDLVPGDVVRLDAGARVPADGVLLEAEGVRLDTSMLTGESVPEPRRRRDAIEAGTILVAGRGDLEVTATGAESAMGRLASMLGGIDRSPTPLQRRLQRFGGTVARGVLVLAAVLLVAGIALGGDPIEMLLLAVALAVAAVPEGLPAVVTGALALGTQRMAARNAVVRRLAAVETLGSVTVVASDKTGTLTENRMRLVDAAWAGEGPAPARAEVLRAAVLCSNAEPDGGGDPLEVALVEAAEAAGVDVVAARRDAPRRAERPFDAEWSYMRTTVEEPTGLVSYLKGAPDRLLDRCALTEDERRRWEERVDERNARGERTLLLARGAGETEEDLAPLALLALHDPPRAASRASVLAAQEAGARVIMITGDHPATARAIARSVGIPVRRVATGDEVDDLTERGELAEIDVFARTPPEKKLAIVQALQRAGHTVAMTGDGVNDSPALRQADVGVAMGERGSDVAREAADLVLLDDDISTLVAAIEEGRGVAANLRSFVRFLFAANLAEVVTVSLGVGAALALGLRDAAGELLVPLTAAQILWINLVTDALPAFALALDRRPGVMRDSPHDADAPLLSGGTLRYVLGGGLSVAALALATFAWVPALGGDASSSRTALFMVLVFAQLALVGGARREGHAPAANPTLWAALALSGAVQVGALAVPVLRDALDLSPIAWATWLGVAASTLVAYLVGRALAAGETRRARPVPTGDAGPAAEGG